MNIIAGSLGCTPETNARCQLYFNFKRRGRGESGYEKRPDIY